MKTIKSIISIKFIILALFLLFTGPGQGSKLLWAQNRQIPLDLYIIIDASERISRDRNEILSWINNELLDRLLQDGDRLVVWTAGNQARIIHSETISGQTNTAKDMLAGFQLAGTNPDFTGAVREAAAMATRENQGGNRLNYTVLISSSAEAMASSLRGSSTELFRWFRTERSSQWQALVIDPNIIQRVNQAAAAFMSAN